MSWIALGCGLSALHLYAERGVLRRPTKSNVLLQRRYSHSVDKSTGVRSDHTVILTAIDSATAYPEALRRVSYLDLETKKQLSS